MTSIYSKALDKTIEVGRIIDSIKSGVDGPTLIFIAGIHGNEPSGIFALSKVLKEVKTNQTQVKGNIYALTGNLWALERGVRYDKQDLNRLWVKEVFDKLKTHDLNHDNKDLEELEDIYNTIMPILELENGPFYFFDLHTTSSETIPFLTVNDSLLNRKFTEQYPAPIILGIEEFLEGPLLSSINELGYVAFGYEGGQHDALSAIENHIAFIYLSMVFAESVNRDDIEFDHYFEQLHKTCIDTQDFYEIYYRHELTTEDHFVMEPGFVNFERISKGQKLAVQNNKEVNSIWHARLFMPLYQAQGNDGFFIIRRIAPFFLALSARLRKMGIHRFLVILPGVKWASKDKNVLMVNLNIARLFAKQFFHLLGYRSKEIRGNKLLLKNREIASRNKEYKNTKWYK